LKTLWFHPGSGYCEIIVREGVNMSQGMELDRILRGAIAAEHAAGLFYGAVADASVAAHARATFRDLADEERVHAVALETVGERFRGNLLPGLSLADFRAVETPPGWAGERAITLARAIDMALAAEVNAAEVYDALARAFEGKTSELFAGLARAEQGHAARLRVLAGRCSDGDLAAPVELDPAIFGAPSDEPTSVFGVPDEVEPPPETWQSGEELISHSTMATHLGSMTVSESNPANSGSSIMRRVLGGHHAGVRQMAFSADGRYLVTVDKASEVFVWSAADGRLVTPLEAPTDGVACLTISPDGHTVAIGSPSGGITLWDLRTVDGD
jgi:rubrerythrin